jgi:hypothetical protein
LVKEKIMKVYFENRFGMLREIADVNSKADADEAVADFLKMYDFKSYYTRHWIQETENYFDVMYDVGSHSEFFRVRFDTYEDAECFIKG